jgi:hypothetical protein
MFPTSGLSQECHLTAASETCCRGEPLLPGDLSRALGSCAQGRRNKRIKHNRERLVIGQRVGDILPHVAFPCIPVRGNGQNRQSGAVSTVTQCQLLAPEQNGAPICRSAACAFSPNLLEAKRAKHHNLTELRNRLPKRSLQGVMIPSRTMWPVSFDSPARLL